MLSLSVSKDSRGDYSTIQEAIEAVPYNTPAKITVCEGIYEERLFSDKRELSIIGRKGESVVVRHALSAREIMPDGRKRGTFRSYSAFFSGEKLKMENITIENNAGAAETAGQSVALYLDVDNAELLDVNLKSAQDTLFLAPLPEEEREKGGFYGPRFLSPRKKNRVLYKGGLIEGSVDFIFGGADAFFENVHIVSNGKGYVAAPSTASDDMGFVFHACHFESVTDDSSYLMRPWRADGKCTFLNCIIGPHIPYPGFSPWPGRVDEAEKAGFYLDSCGYASGKISEEKYKPTEEQLKKIFTFLALK